MSLTLLAALVAAVLARDGAPFGIDTAGHREALELRSEPLTDAMIALTFTGTGAIAYLLAAAAGAVLGSPHRLRGAVAAMLALAVGQSLRLSLAVAIGRERPPEADWAWDAGGPALPSGHTSSSAMVAALLCAAAVRGASGRARTAVVLAALTWAAAVGLTRIYLGVHWPTDVLAGWLYAATVAFTAVALANARPTAASRTPR